MAQRAPSLRSHLTCAKYLPPVGEWYEVRCLDFDGLRFKTVAQVAAISRAFGVVELHLTPSDTWRVAQVVQLLERYEAKPTRRAAPAAVDQFALF